jgi:hypothetical protein
MARQRVLVLRWVVAKRRPDVTGRLLAEAETARHEAGRALHREVAPLLAAAILELHLAGEPAPRALEILDRSVKALREIELGLRPPLLDEAGLGPSLRWLGERTRAQVMLPDGLPRLPAALEWQLYLGIEGLLRRGLRPGTARLSLDPGKPPRLRVSGRPGKHGTFALAALRARLRGTAPVSVARKPAGSLTVSVALQKPARPPRTFLAMTAKIERRRGGR